MASFSRRAPLPATDQYSRLITALASRAVRLGASDPEGAAQEAVKRSLAHPLSSAAVDYYFGEGSADGEAPAWTLLQLLGWLHGVLRFVVLEERPRARREVATADPPDVVDPARTPLEQMIDGELRDIVRQALSTLNADQRSAVLLRLQGRKYADIAKRLGVNENTVATWIRRGSRALVDSVHRRMRAAGAGQSLPNIASASHG
jgi:RNA polymerase sigma factor (sigma-70 family)